MSNSVWNKNVNAMGNKQIGKNNRINKYVYIKQNRDVSIRQQFCL